jgi:hypothetical protein
MRCDEIVEAGAYVLGALAPGERAAYERHLATCAACREEVAQLAGLPGLLGRLDPDTALAVGRPVAAPPELMDKVLAGARGERMRILRQRRWQAAIVTAAAACLALLAGIGVYAVDQNRTETPSVIAAMKPAESDIPVTAVIGLSPAKGGTDITMVCFYAQSSVYHGQWTVDLMVYSRSGAIEQVPGWTVSQGESAQVLEHMKTPLDQITRIELRRSNVVLLYYSST